MLMYKYMPKRLDDFELTDDMRAFIRMLIQSGSLTVLLVGNRKTSLLNAMLCEYYGLPADGNMMACENVMYVNNISDFGVSFYRQTLKTFCQSHFTITGGLKKTIVLDNIDCIKMKNVYVQQICNNLIETYSDRVNFVVTCTNIKKVIENIQSRTMILSIPLLSERHLTNILNQICEKEGIRLDAGVMDYLLSIGKNNVNILMNYLEKFKLLLGPSSGSDSSSSITLEKASEMCTNISFTVFQQYLDAIEKKRLPEAMEIMANLTDVGYSVVDVLDVFFLFVKSSNCVLSDEKKYVVIPLICKYIIYFNTIQENDCDLFLLTNVLIQKLSR